MRLEFEFKPSLGEIGFVGEGTIMGPVRACLGGPTEAEPQVSPLLAAMTHP